MAFEGHAATVANGVVTRDEGVAADLLPVAGADHHGRRASSSRTSPPSSASSTRKTIRAAIRASRCSMPASTSARCSRRSSAATSGRRWAGATASARPASACCSAWPVPVGTEIPARPRRTAMRRQAARTRAGPAARMGDLPRRDRRPAAGGVADVGGRQRRVLARRRSLAGAGADDPGDGGRCWCGSSGSSRPNARRCNATR